VPVFASLAQLAAALRAQAGATGAIDLGEAAIWGTSGRVPALMQSHLGRPDLKLLVSADAIPANPIDTLAFAVSTPAAQSDTFLSLLGVADVQISFELIGSDDEVNFTLSVPLPATWTLARSWPQLASDPVAAELPLESPQLLFDTHPGAAAPLTFSSQLSLTDQGSGLALVGELLPEVKLPTVTLQGEIAPGPRFDLHVDLLAHGPPPLDGLVKIGPPYLGLRSLQVPFDEAPGSPTYTAAQWLIGADVELGGGAADLTFAAIAVPELSGFALEILPAHPEGTTLQALVDALLGPVTPGSFKDLFGELPFVQQVYDDLMGAFAFKQFAALFTLGTGAGIRYLSLNVGSTLDPNGKPKYRLPIIPGGVLSAEDFELQWILFEPASPDRTMLLSIDATLVFAKDIPFALEVALPNFIVEGRYVGTPLTLTLAELEQRVFGGELSIPLGIDVTFTGLQLEANPPAGVYTMTVAAGADVELFGARVLSISNAVLTVTRSYPSGSTTAQNAFAFHGIVALGPLAFDVSAQVGSGDTIFALHMVGQTLGGLLGELVELVDPYLDLRLEAPWNKLGAISLDALLLTVNVTQGTIALDYPIGLDLGFVKLERIGLNYQRAQQAKPSALAIELSCTFLGLHYGGDSGKPSLGWNPVSDRAPALPGAGAALLDLRYLALGQHVRVAGGDLTTIANVFKTLRGTAVPLSPGASDPSALPGVVFDPDSQWLIAAQFTVMGTVSLSGVFCDPSLAGIRLALAGEKAGSFAGLEFEILYTRVTPTIGLYHIELKLPDAMRHLEFGEVSVTLPVLALDVYTNGNFRVDLGFPQGLDFSRSFSIQAFPFVGYGGFYFALLDGQTSKRVPQITNGQFSPVIEFGLALSLGVGKTIEEGILSAGASVTVIGIVTGVVGWFEPSGSDVHSDRYYWVQGTVALSGQVFGKVDFAIVSVEFQITVQASITLTIEAYRPIHVALLASVSVRASIKILFIRIHFSFSIQLNLAFDIGHSGATPWQLASDGSNGQPHLRAQAARRPAATPVHLEVHTGRRAFLGLAPHPRAELDFAPRGVSHLLAGSAPAKQTLDVVLVPAFTRNDGGGPVACVLAPFIENSIVAGAHTAAETQVVSATAADAPFNQLAARLFAWTLGALEHIDGPQALVSADDLGRVAEALYDPDVEQGPLAYAKLEEFLEANFTLRLFARTPGVSGELSAALFPMPPELTLTVGGQSIDFAAQTLVDSAYQQTIDAYLQQLAVAYESDVEAAHGGGGAGARALARAGGGGAPQSMAQLVFGNWCTMLARASVNAAIAILRAYPYEVPATGSPSLADVAASFPAASGVYVCAVGDTLATLAAAHGSTTAAIRALNPALGPIGDGDPLPVGLRLTLPVLVTPASILAANADATGVFATGAVLPLSGVQYQVRSGDSLASLARRLAAVAQLHVDANALAAALLARNTSAAVLQPGVVLTIDAVRAYTTRAGETLAHVASAYLVRTAGAAVLNLITGLAQLVEQTIVANPKPGGGTWGMNEPLPDGTEIAVPPTLASSGQVSARLGDTIARIAGALLAPGVPGVELTPLVAALATANPGLSSTDPLAPLPPGTALAVPPLTVNVQPGDTLDGIAAAFGLAGEALGQQLLATPGVLAVGAILAVPDLRWQPAAADTPASIAAQLNLTLVDLSASIAAVRGALAPGAKLAIPQVPALTLAQLQRQLLLGADLNTAAATISRFLMHGLRLPSPRHAGTLAAGALAGAQTAPLFALVGQQFPVGGGELVLAPNAGAEVELYMGGYAIQAGDTLGAIAQRFAPAGQQAALAAALAQLNPSVDPEHLAPGELLVFPGASSYRVAAGDTLATITARFATSGLGELFAAELRALNPGVDFRQPLAAGTELALPRADTATAVQDDTLEILAARFVPADSVSAFVARLVALNPGLAPSVAIPAGTVIALPRVTLLLAVSQLGLSFSGEEQATIAALEHETFDAVATVERLPLFRAVPLRWSLAHVLHWQVALPLAGTRFAGAPVAGEPTIWPFPPSLCERLAASGGGEPALELATARAGAPGEPAATAVLGSYAWATMLDVGIRLVDGPDGPLPNRYLVTGAGDADRDRLELLWDYLGASNGMASASLLYAPSPAAGNPAGLVSDALAREQTVLVQANLSTLSSSGAGVTRTRDAPLTGAPPLLAHSATLDEVSPLVKLLWECTVVHGGGYYLQYATGAGGGLPEHLFSHGPETRLTLLVLVDEGVAPPAAPPLHAAHNCAVLAGNVDAGSTEVFVRPVTATTSTAQQPAAAPTQLLAAAPAGTTGFRVSRPDPGPDTGASGLDTIFQLLAFSIAATGGFRASPEGLPVGPASGDDGVDAVEEGTWDYRKLLPVARFAEDELPIDPPAGVAWVLPSPWLDPYRGIAPNSEVTVELSFRDVYGNAAGGGGTLDPLELPVGYFDELLGLGAWPSVAADYEFVPGMRLGERPACVLELSFDPAHYLATPGLGAAAAARNAAARRVRFAQIHYQLRQSDVGARLRCSLDQPGSDPTPYPLALAPLRAFVASVHAFLSAAEGLLAYRHALAENETLAELAARFAVSVAELASANADVEAAPLFASGALAIPVFYRYRHGDTLRTSGLLATQVEQGSMDLALAEGADLSLASQPSSCTLANGATLRQLARAARAAPGALASANAEHPLTAGVVLAAGGVSLATGAQDTLNTMVARFAAATPPVVRTTAALGADNQDIEDLFDAERSSTLRVADRLVAAGETLRMLTTGAGAPRIGALLADNQDLPDVFAAGAALWMSNQIYRLQPGDTLGGVAARFGVDLAVLANVAANALAPLTAARRATLAVPGQLVFGPAGPAPSVRVLDVAPTAELLAGNRYTQDLLVAGTLRLGEVSVDVRASDLLDTVCTRARDAGYDGDFTRFAADAAAAIAGGAAILAGGAAWVCAPLTVRAATPVAETLEALAARAGVSTDALIRANGALRGVLRSGASLTFPATSKNPVTLAVLADETLTTLAARFTDAGAPVTLDELSQHAEFTRADILALGAPLVPAALTVVETVPFTATPQNPETIFPVEVRVELTRASDRVDPDFKDLESVALAGTRVAAKAAPGDDAARTLGQFAERFEAAFPGLKAAVSQRREDPGQPSEAGQVWAVDLRGGGLGFQIEQGDGRTPNPHATYFALAPLANDLLGYSDVAVQPYASGEPLGGAVAHAFRSVDLDAWMNQFLSAVDDFLSAASAPAARALAPALLDRVIADKQRIAEYLAGMVEPVFDDGPAGDLAAARGAFEQELLVTLASAYRVSTIVQLPVAVRAPAGLDPNTAPRLSGTPVASATSGKSDTKAQRAGTGDPAAPCSLSTAKVPLAPGTQRLTFTVAVKQPETERTLSLDLRYAVTEIEHAIANVDGIADYQRSSWLTLLRPQTLAANESIGPLAVPVPLRANPSPPTLLTQGAAASGGGGGDETSILDRLKRWDYTFGFEHPSADQDTRFVKVMFNTSPSGDARERAGNLEALFGALAQFVSVHPALQADLSALPTLAPGAGTATSANAVAVFADLVHRVAGALVPLPTEPMLGDDGTGVTLEYTVTADAEARTMTLTLAAPPPASVGWPDVYALLQEHTHQLVGANVAPTASARSYSYPADVSPSAPAYVWRFAGLDVTRLQSAVSAMWVVRNQNLGGLGARSVNDDFVYRTASVAFASPVVPLLLSRLAVPIGSLDQPVASALEAVFEDLLGSPPGSSWSAQVKLAACYGYSLGEGGALSALLPIFLISRQAVTSEGVTAFATEVEDLLARWSATEGPNPQGGAYIFELALHAAQPPTTGPPVLDLQNLVYRLA
jgi:LysM repeat protein